ncbi:MULTISPECIES: hypothetical protein [Sphingobacterium]|uniref:hypothetical protein n=1 Tax=Sphingobacterium TaxID=28453 RepID=UPI00104ED9B5|nr:MULTISPECIES: hypothetical protein [Sphingobacterium]MCW2263121.1 hypothetical protein [Sphingobacterium kitahiroshimense]TCR11896.1 hypothetical protein EDF67_103309 [Sphingobacterium sp. JUb78]
MKKYYINNSIQANGDYEVHAQGCVFFPTQDSTYLGEFWACQSAVVEAKRRFPLRKINGCYYCSRECHTS